jgi:(R,R)-butanediol dehydrogenase/meso-butanediol dehydrogenase/diacetyl reductase
MKAVVVRNKDMVLEDVIKPKAGFGEVVLKVRYCGICGSEVHRFEAGSFPDGAICGHEPYGVIDEVGEGVEGWKKGDRIVVIAYEPCRKCRWCQQGEYQLCLKKEWIGIGTNPGGFAEYVKAYASMLVRVPEQVNDREAALTEPLAVALHAVRSTHINMGDTVAVIGAGPIGLLVLQCSRVAGARAVGVIEAAKARLDLAAKLGADVIFAPEIKNIGLEVTEALGAEPDVVFDCAGGIATLQSAIELVRPHGTVMVVGVSMEPVPIIPIQWGRKEALLKTTIAYRDEFPLALELIAKGKIDVECLISDIIPLNDVGHTIKALSRPNQQIKILVDPELDHV